MTATPSGALWRVSKEELARQATALHHQECNDICNARWPDVEVMNVVLGYAREARDDVLELIGELDGAPLEIEEMPEGAHDALKECTHLLSTMIWTAINVIKNTSIRQTYIKKAKESVQYFQNEVLKMVDSEQERDLMTQEISVLKAGLVQSHHILQTAAVLKESVPYSRLAEWLTNIAITLPELLQDIAQQGWSRAGWATSFKWRETYPAESFPSGPKFQDLATGDQLLVLQHILHRSGAVDSGVRVFTKALEESGVEIALLTLGSLMYDAALVGGQVIDPLSESIKVQTSGVVNEAGGNMETTTPLGTYTGREVQQSSCVLGSDIYGFLLGTQLGAKQDAMFNLAMDALCMRCPGALFTGTFQALILPLSTPLNSSLQPPKQRIW